MQRGVFFTKLVGLMEVKMFLIEITNVLKGIDNLKITYNTDITILTELNIIQNKLKERLDKLNNKLQIIIE